MEKFVHFTVKLPGALWWVSCRLKKVAEGRDSPLVPPAPMNRIAQIKNQLELTDAITIGNVTLEIESNSLPELIPIECLTTSNDVILEQLQWIMKKVKLKQDLFLSSQPGPLSRHLIMTLASLLQKQLHVVTLTRDTGDVELKQHREVMNNSIHWCDSLVIKAAVTGSWLVVDGVDKAELNVLPILNNLLENRQMSLDSGQLVRDTYYDALVAQGKCVDGLMRVHPNFLVIALGTSVPPYKGNALDPPFRSRFQCKWIEGYPLHVTRGVDSNDNCNGNCNNVDNNKSHFLTNVIHLLETINFTNRMETSIQTVKFPIPPQTSLSTLHSLFKLFPNDQLSLIQRVYPYIAIKGAMSKDERLAFWKLMEQFDLAVQLGSRFSESQQSEQGNQREQGDKILIHLNSIKQQSSYTLVKIQDTQDTLNKTITLNTINFTVPCGPWKTQNADGYIPLPRFQDTIVRMIQSHISGMDMCLVGPRGCGKSTLANQFSSLLGYSVENIYCYKDMMSRDFFQRRVTGSDGSTLWENSSLVNAALKGDLCVIHDVEFLDPGTFSSLARMCQDREADLPDGTKLISPAHFASFDEDWEERWKEGQGVKVVDPAFRIVVVASSPDYVAPGTSLSDAVPWLREEIVCMFQFIHIPMLDQSETQTLLTTLGYSGKKLMQFVQVLQQSEDGTVKEVDLAASSALLKNVHFTLRTIIRICQRNEDLHGAILRVSLYPFLSILAKQALDQILLHCEIYPGKEADISPPERRGDSIKFGNVVLPVYKPASEDLKLIPNVPGFHPNPLHSKIMASMALDLSLGNHLLLLGVQGVGKNRITDELLSLLNRPVNYIQLYRDSTVLQILVKVDVVDGRLIYSDSPLVDAVRNGRVMVIDEADKAPVYVTSVLKAIAEGEITLPDGRKLLPKSKQHAKREQDVVFHDDFRLVLLANRAGNGFLGNDFFGIIGDLFSVHCIENPEFESEFQIARNFAPALSVGVVSRLVRIFQTLRELFVKGVLHHPFSLRELLQILKHLNMFPQDPLYEVLGNAFDFDVLRLDVVSLLRRVLEEHDVDVKNFGVNMMTVKKEEERRRIRGSVEMKVVKKGVLVSPGLAKKRDNMGVQSDLKGFGGVGGSGGSGGIGGTSKMQGGDLTDYSHSLSLEITDKMRIAALNTARESLETRLEEIGMEKGDARDYYDLLSNVKHQIVQLKLVLEGVKAKQKERVWIKNQTDGELDDKKIADLLIGDKNVYKKRGESNHIESQKKPKRIFVLWDLSGSMYRFDKVDGRLTRSLQAAVMIMEALNGMDRKYVYRFYGHSGDSDWFPLFDAVPKNEAERFQVVKRMLLHAQNCQSGDSTFSSLRKGILEITKEEADDYQVIVTSDSNLGRYGLSLGDLSDILVKTDSRVNSTVLFIGSAGEEAKTLQNHLPPGKSYVCLTTESVPNIIKEIFTSTITS
jgi:MoxR-like ATPase